MGERSAFSGIPRWGALGRLVEELWLRMQAGSVSKLPVRSPELSQFTGFITIWGKDCIKILSGTALVRGAVSASRMQSGTEGLV